jgi:hypothetical protein
MHHFFYSPHSSVRLWTPYRLDEPFLWLAAIDAGSDSVVAEWVSRDAGAYEFTTTEEPSYDDSGNNSRPTVDFTTGDYVSNENSFFANDGFTIAILYGASGNQTLFRHTSENYIEKDLEVRIIGGKVRIIQKNKGVALSLMGSTVLSGFHLIEIHGSGININRKGICSRPISALEILKESFTVKIDGVTETLTSGPPITLSGDTKQLLLGQTLTGSVQQLLIYPTQLDADNKAYLNNYLMEYGGL